MLKRRPGGALLSLLAEKASSSRAGLGYEVIVSRLDDRGQLAPVLQAAHRYGARLPWAGSTSEQATADVAVGEPDQQVGSQAGRRQLRIRNAVGGAPSAGDDQAIARHWGALVVVDHSAAAPYRLLDIRGNRRR